MNTEQLFILPVGKESVAVFRMHDQSETTILFCFSQVSAHACLQDNFIANKIPYPFSTEKIMGFLDEGKVPDFDEHDEVILDGHIASVISLSLDVVQMLCEQEHNFMDSYTDFRNQFYRCFEIPNPAKQFRNLNSKREYSAIYAWSDPYGVKIFYSKKDALFIHKELGEKRIRKAVIHSLVPYESVEPVREIHGKAAETIAYLIWLKRWVEDQVIV